MSTSISPRRWPGSRRFIVAAGVSAVVLAAAVAPSSATGSTSASVTVAASINGVVGAPAVTGEPSTVGLTLTNQSLKKVAGYVVVVPKGIGTVTNLGVDNSGWSQTKSSCGWVSNCSALYFVLAKTSAAQLPQGASITSRFGVTPPAVGTAQFRILGVGSNYSGLVVIGAQPTISIVNGVATALEVSVSPPVVKGEPNEVTVRSVREYPAGTFTPKPFPGPLSLTAGNGDELDYAAPDVTGLTEVTFDVTFPRVQVSPQQTLTANSGSISGSAEFDVVAAGVSGSGTEITLTGAGGTTYTAVLPNGSNGPVEFTEVPCTALPGEPDCDTEVNLFGKFKTDAGVPLYTNDNPAAVEWGCPASECEYREPEGSYGQNVQEQWVDFENFKIEVSLRLDNGDYTDFAEASFCNEKKDNPSNGVKGKITDPAAIAAGFCVDVYSISRAGDSFGGDLTIPVLFVEDPKLRGI
jgi:hypothetical protein